MAVPHEKWATVALMYKGVDHTEVLPEDMTFDDLEEMAARLFDVETRRYNLIFLEQRPVTDSSAGDKSYDFFRISDTEHLRGAIVSAATNDYTVQLRMSLKEKDKPIPEEELVPARLLNNIKLSSSGGGDADSESSSVLIIGGTHGNETNGIDGVQLLSDFFSDAAKHRHPLAEFIMNRLKMVLVPCINPIGNLANARCCPTSPDMPIHYVDGRVIVKEDEKGSIKPPKGWEDPNRGLESNKTLVRDHLERLIRMNDPKFIVFNHDWALPRGVVRVTGDDYDVKVIENVPKVFDSYHQYRDTSLEWVDAIGRQETLPENERSTPWPIWKEREIPGYTVETYFMESETGPRIHVAVTLFILAKRAGWDDGDDDAALIKMCLDAAESM